MQTVEIDLLKHIKETEFVLDSSKLNHLSGSVAIVGNSGNLLDHEYGELIDSHDFVIRFNAAPTKGYESNVGAKKNIRLINSHMFWAVLDNTHFDVEETAKIFSKFDRCALYKIENEIIVVKNHVPPDQFTDVIKTVEEKNNKMLFIDEQQHNLYGFLLNTYPTCGFFGLIFALKYFQKISCFGFSFFEDGWEKRHYFEKIKPHDTSCHNFENEKLFFHLLADHNLIKIYPEAKV